MVSQNFFFLRVETRYAWNWQCTDLAICKEDKIALVANGIFIFTLGPNKMFGAIELNFAPASSIKTTNAIWYLN